MKRTIGLYAIFLFCISCSGDRIEKAEKDKQINSEFNYISLKMEYLDSIDFSFMDKEDILYYEDSTFIVFPDEKDLVFYHVESKSERHRLTFSINIENCSQISAHSPQDVAVLNDRSVLRLRNGEEEIHELGKGAFGLYWDPHCGFEYFSDLNKVVLGLNFRRWPEEGKLDSILTGLGEYDLTTKTISKLPFEYSEFGRRKDYWGYGEFYISSSNNSNELVISENWSDAVYVINMRNKEMVKHVVPHSSEQLLADLPANLDDYPELIPAEGEQKTVKYALWELRHYYFEKYGKAFISLDGNSIYRLYYHRIPLKMNGEDTHRSNKAISLIHYDTKEDKRREFLMFGDHFYVFPNFWLSNKNTIDHIRFHYTKERDVENAIYFLEHIKPVSIIN